MNESYYKSPKASRLMKLLWSAAGADAHILNKSTYSDHVKYACLGGIVVATGLMAAMAGGYAFYIIFGQEVESINGLDNLVKERQLIRSAREKFANEEEKKKQLAPLLFAGILIEGAVIAYDANLESGGVGARYLGIGSTVQYREDNITVSLRMVSVATGEILIEVLSQKTIFSYGKSEDIFRFIEMGTQLVEIELGNSRNESTTLALMKAIESAVLELINVGYDRSFWKHEQIKIKESDCIDDDCITSIG